VATETGAIMAYLMGMHQAPAWAGYRELATTTGARELRTIDYYAMSCWPSTGQTAISYEVKVSRADFMRELEDPAKRAPAEDVSTECWFVMPPGLVRPDEVPARWGLMTYADGKVRRVKMAEQRRLTALPFWFVASLARRSQDPPLPPPAPLWRYAGRELTREQVIAMGEGERAETVTREVDRLVRQALADQQQRQTDAEAMAAAVRAQCGWTVTTPEAFRHWCEPLMRGRQVTSRMVALSEHLADLAALIDQCLAEGDVTGEVKHGE